MALIQKMNICKVDTCEIVINKKTYKTPGFIREWLVVNNRVVIACCDTMMFLSLSPDEAIIYAPESITEFSQYFTFKNECILNYKNYIVVTDTRGNGHEMYFYPNPVFHLNIHITKDYIIAILGPSHDRCLMFIHCRSQMTQYIKTQRNLHTGFNYEEFRDKVLLSYKLIEIRHALDPDLVCKDGYNGFNKLKLKGNILTYNSSKKKLITVTLPTAPHIKREPKTASIIKQEKLEKELGEYEYELANIKYKKDHCRSKYKIMHYDEQLDDIHEQITPIKTELELLSKEQS